MLSTNDLLDLAKGRNGIGSDYKLAQVLGVAKSAVLNYRSGRSHPDDRVCRRLAELTGEDAGDLAVWMQVERSRDDEARSLWTGIAQRLERAGLAAALAVFMLLGVSITPESHAKSAQISSTAGNSEYYVKWLTRLLARLRRRRQWSFGGTPVHAMA